MSKGNLFMGFGRGKVGSVVLARSNGQQVARAYNDAPKNPRSEGQMMQRSIFASAVKFFSQGRQAFYQFAFENKSAKQSDYNAFVAANAKRGMHVSKAAFDESTYPVLAPWMMSKGSLPELDLVYDNEGNKYKLNLAGLSAGATWGAVSQMLKDMYGLNGGDIVTIVTINAQGSNADNTPAVEPEKRGQIKWDIKQALLDVGSDSAVADIFGTGAVAIEGGITFMGVASADTACGACVTISRMTDAGLKVNDSYIVMNGVAATIYENCKAQDYIDKVLASWKASGKAILEGGLLSSTGSNEYPDTGFYISPNVIDYNKDVTETVVKLINTTGIAYSASPSSIVKAIINGKEVTKSGTTDFGDFTLKLSTTGISSPEFTVLLEPKVSSTLPSFINEYFHITKVTMGVVDTETTDDVTIEAYPHN